MNAKSLSIGTVAGAVVLFVMGYVIFELLLSGVYESYADVSVNRPEPDMLHLGLSTLVWAFFLTYVLSKWPGERSLVKGATTGAVIGLLVMLSVDLSFFAMTTLLQPLMLIIDPLAGAAWSACAGAAIGYVLSRTG